MTDADYGRLPDAYRVHYTTDRMITRRGSMTLFQ
jgi:hypothetical protein